MSSLGRALASLSNRWIATTTARRQEIISLVATTLRNQVDEAVTNPDPPPTAFTMIVEIPTADADYFTNNIADTILAESFGIDLEEHYIRSHVFNQISCGQPQYALQVTVVRRQ